MRIVRALSGLAGAFVLALFLTVLVAYPVLAYLYSAPVAITESGGSAHTNLPVIIDVDVDGLIAGGFITDAGALDTRIETQGGVAQIHMAADDKVLAFVPSLSANSQLNWSFTTGNSVLSGFPVIVGDGGYVTVADHANLELGNNFEIEFEGWVDTSASNTISYPVVETTITSVRGTSSTSHPVSLPSGITAGDLLIMVAEFGGPTSRTLTFPPADWTTLALRGNSSSNILAIAYKVASGSEGSSVTLTTDGGIYSAHQAFRISGYSGVPEIASAITATNSATPDPPNLTVSWAAKRTLWIAGFGSMQNSPRTCSSYPTNYTNGQFLQGGGVPAVGTARRLLEASSEDPGTFTLSDSMGWRGFTIAVQGAKPTSSFIYKTDAFYIYPNSGTVNAGIWGTAGVRTVTATGVSSGEYIVKVWADGTDFGIDIDGVTADSTALAGASVSDNANNLVISALPYMNYYSHTVGVNHRIQYEPDTMISGTTLVNEENPGTYNGVITWGSNPSGVATSLGGLTPPAEEDWSESGTTHRDVLPTTDTSDWFDEDISVRLVNNPFRPIVTLASDNTTMTELQAWRLWGLAILLLVTVGTARMLHGHYLITGIACAGAIGVLVHFTIWPGWSLVFIIPAIVAGVIAERTPSL